MKDRSRALPVDDGLVRKSAGPLVRGARSDDLDAIMEIERACFGSPWPRQAMRDEISRFRIWSRAEVALLDGEIGGFSVYWVVASELHLLDLAVAPRFRRRGVARALIAHMLQREDGIDLVVLEVRRSNFAARGLYRSFGFAELGVRERYYADDGEDAIVMGLVPGE
ncbi:MAG: ribosomal protein S18-alanine N-acetyltransferase [Polyangia bacterium]